MKLIRLLLSGVIILLLFSSCTSFGRYLYYYETPSEQDSKMTLAEPLPLVSIQLSGREVTWSRSSGNVTTVYSFEFKNANEYANQVFEYIPIERLGVYIPNVLHDGNLRLSDYIDYKSWIRYNSYDWGIPVVDNKNQPAAMDPNILKMLNDNIDSDYYLVLDGDILRYQWKSWFGLIPFRMTYEITMVVYDNQGKKVISNHYRHDLKKAPGSIYKPDTYYKGLEISLENVKDEIIRDLEHLGAVPYPADSTTGEDV